ncbi:MAG: membrane dipeptidase [Anaerolineae bacterium]|nr:membrane dipeptidase [Anaerolineae bacterium]
MFERVTFRRLSRRQFLALSAAAALSSFLPVRHSADPLFLVDAHLDLGWNLTNYGRDYTRSAYITRALETKRAVERIAGKAMLGLPELLAAQVAVLFGVIFVMPRRAVSSVLQIAHYATSDEAHAWALRMVADIERFAAQSRRTLFIRSAADLENILTTWHPSVPPEARRIGILLAMEGADPVRTPADFAAWYARGLRCVGLAWLRTRYAGSDTEPSGLTAQGEALLREMSAYRVILDTAHLAEQAFWDCLRHWQGAIIYSHGVPRHFLATQRALSDAQIAALVERNGVIGVGLYSGFYRRRRGIGFTVEDVADAIDYICQRFGSAYVALGSDLDGGFGADHAPQGIQTIADLSKVFAALQSRGYTQADLRAIAHGNWLRVLRSAL